MDQRVAPVSGPLRGQDTHGAERAPESPAYDPGGRGLAPGIGAEGYGETVDRDPHERRDDLDDPVEEIAAILATGYVRLLLAMAANATSPDVSAGCGGEKSNLRSDIPLDEAERKSVHVGDGIKGEKRPGARRARPR